MPFFGELQPNATIHNFDRTKSPAPPPHILGISHPQLLEQCQSLFAHRLCIDTKSVQFVTSRESIFDLSDLVSIAQSDPIGMRHRLYELTCTLLRPLYVFLWLDSMSSCFDAERFLSYLDQALVGAADAVQWFISCTVATAPLCSCDRCHRMQQISIDPTFLLKLPLRGLRVLHRSAVVDFYKRLLDGQHVHRWLQLRRRALRGERC